VKAFISAGLMIVTMLIAGASGRPPGAQSPLERLFARIPPRSIARPGTEAEYRFSVDYINADAHGTPSSTQRIVGTYVVNPISGMTTWRSVTAGSAPGSPTEVKASEHQPFIEGMHYDRSAKPFSADFFARFPPQATPEKNLVWDTWMFDEFIESSLDKLEPNVPIRFASGEVSLGGAGSFLNKDIRLTWVGVSRRNGRDCALVRYEAFLNTFTIELPGMKVVGRSEFWGDMWVALDSRILEFATLREEVVGNVTSEQTGTQAIHVLRVGYVERTN